MKGIVSYVAFALNLLSGTGAAVAQGSAAGKAAFSKCQACHAVGRGAKNKLGSELNGLAGRKAGTAAGHQYSPAMMNAGITWDQTIFAAFIASPRGKILRNKIVFAGIKDETEIANLWAYLSHSMSTVAQSDNEHERTDETAILVPTRINRTSTHLGERRQSPGERAKLDGLWECIPCLYCSTSCPS